MPSQPQARRVTLTFYASGARAWHVQSVVWKPPRNKKNGSGNMQNKGKAAQKNGIAQIASECSPCCGVPEMSNSSGDLGDGEDRGKL